jgi:endonuclease/exonuclease/phosphatase family metal-dependent hydrolase
MRLATFNILHGKSPVDGEVDLGRYASAIAAIDADVLALQEVDCGQPRSHGADLTALAAEAMGATDHHFAATLVGTPDLWSPATGDVPPGSASYGVALLSRHPVVSWYEVTLPPLRRRVPVRRRGRRLPVLQREEPRVAIAAVIDAPGGLLTVVSTHLTFIPGRNAIQLRRLVREVAWLPRPLVVMGDLNLTGDVPRRLSGWKPLASAPTFPTEEPTRQIDHILADGAVRATSTGVAVDLGMSDHRALVVDAERVPGAREPRQPDRGRAARYGGQPPKRQG